MKQTGTLAFMLILASALALGPVEVSHARGGMGPGWGGGGRGPCRMFGPMGGPGWATDNPPIARIEQRLDHIKTRLTITPDQAAAWNTYAEAVRTQVGMMVSHRQTMVGGTVTPDQHAAMRQQGCAHRQKLDQATQALYAVLTPEQRATGGLPSVPGGGRCPR